MTNDEKAARYDLLIETFKKEYENRNVKYGFKPEYIAYAILRLEIDEPVCINYGDSSNGSRCRLNWHAYKAGKEVLLYEVDRDPTEWEKEKIKKPKKGYKGDLQDDVCN